MAAAGQVGRPGRPPKAAEERLSEPISFRLTPSEMDVLCVEAIRLGISVHDYVRRLIRRARAAEIAVSPKCPNPSQSGGPGLISGGR